MADREKEIRKAAEAESEYAKNSEIARQITAQITLEARDLNAELREQLGLTRRRSEEDKVLIKLSQDLTRSASLNNVELRRSDELNRQLIKDRRNLVQLVNEQTIFEKTLSEGQKKRAAFIQKNNTQRVKAERELQSLRAQLVKASEEESDVILEKIKEQEGLVASAEAGLRIGLKGADAETQRYALLLQTTAATKELIKSRKEEAKKAIKINENLGLTGAILDNLNKAGLRAFGGLGLNLGTFQDSIKKTTEKAEKLAENLEGPDGKNLTDFQKKLKVFKVTAIGAGKALGKALLDPLTVAKMLVDQFFAIDKAAVELSRTTGQSFGALDGFTGRFATAVDLAEVITAETKQSGLNANNIFSKDVLAGAAEFKNLVGGSAEEIAGLLSLTAATGINTDAIQESIVDATSAFNGANRAAVSQRTVLNDVLTSSTSIQASLAGNPKALAEAASAARRLGLSLSEVDQIASSLLDFESSINSELEAQLLTGRSINLSKARELALNNDLAGLSDEIFKNQVSVAEFSQMNRIQQEGLAKALGMSRDQLANMAFQQAKMNGMTDEAAAAAAGVSLADMQRVEAIEALNKSLTSLLQIFAPIFDGISKIFNLAAQFPRITKTVLALGIAFKMFGNPLTAAAKGIGGVVNSFNSLRSNKNNSGGILKYLKDGYQTAKDFGKRLTTLAKGGDILKDDRLTSGYRDRLTGRAVSREKGDKFFGITRDTTKEAGKKASETLESTQDLAPQKDLGEKIEEFLTGLSNGLKQMGRKGVLKGALNLIPASLGLVAMIPGSVGAFLVSRLNGPALAAGLTGLGTGLAVMGTGIAAKGAAVLGLAALSFIALLPALPVMALLAVVGPLASAGLGALATGIGVLQAVGAVPFLLSLAAVGVSIAAIFLGVGFAIKSAAEGISLLASSLTLDKVRVLGAAAVAITSLAGALTLFGTAGLLALPALLAVAPLVTALSRSEEAGATKGQNTMAKVEEKLDLLISAVKEDKKIFIDGRQLEEVITFR